MEGWFALTERAVRAGQGQQDAFCCRLTLLRCSTSAVHTQETIRTGQSALYTCRCSKVYSNTSAVKQACQRGTHIGRDLASIRAGTEHCTWCMPGQPHRLHPQGPESCETIRSPCGVCAQRWHARHAFRIPTPQVHADTMKFNGPGPHIVNERCVTNTAAHAHITLFSHARVLQTSDAGHRLGRALGGVDRADGAGPGAAAQGPRRRRGAAYHLRQLDTHHQVLLVLSDCWLLCETARCKSSLSSPCCTRPCLPAPLAKPARASNLLAGGLSQRPLACSAPAQR